LARTFNIVAWPHPIVSVHPCWKVGILSSI